MRSVPDLTKTIV